METNTTNTSTTTTNQDATATAQQVQDGQNTAQNTAQNVTAQFDELLKTEGMQAEFDRRITKALQTQETRLNGSMKSQIDEAVAEALKVAKMTADEKAKHEAQKQSEALAKREAEITRRELRASAREELAKRGLPAGLVETLNYSDSDSMTASIDAISSAFQSAVQASVDARLKGGSPLQKAENTDTKNLEDIIMQNMKNYAGF